MNVTIPKLCLLSISFAFISQSVPAQLIHEAKAGLGISFLGTGDVLIVKLESEAVHRLNRYFSGSLAIGVGYGDSRWYDTNKYATLFSRDATVNLDGNLFFSPFGNDRAYHFKIGTGPSLMYVRDQSYRDYGVLDRTYEPSEHRFSWGGSVIVEQEVRIKQQYTVGLKTMFQPYLNGDGAITLLLKVGKVL